MTKPDEDPIEAADRLSASMKSLGNELAELRSYGHRSRTLIGLVAILSGVILAVAVVAIVAAVNASSANDAAHRNQQTAVSACQAANDSREQNRQLWMHVVDLVTTAQTHPTPAQAQAITAFKTKINTTFAQRDCAAANPYTNPPTGKSPPPTP